MADSLQNWVGRNRPPRVQITYDVEIGDAVEKRELPLVVGVLADLMGKPASAPPKMKDRRFVEIDRDNFDEIMTKIGPRLDMSVPDTMKGNGNLKVELNFREFGDFHPEAVVQQVPRLQKLLQARLELRDLLAKLDGNDDLDGVLAEIVGNTDGLREIRAVTEDGEAATSNAQATAGAASAANGGADTTTGDDASADGNAGGAPAAE